MTGKLRYGHTVIGIVLTAILLQDYYIMAFALLQ